MMQYLRPLITNMSQVVWYFAENGKTHGPLAWDGLQAAVQDGRLTKRGLVWSPGTDDWVPSAIVPWLIYAAASPSLSSASATSGTAGTEQLVTSPPPLKAEAGRRWKWPSAASPFKRFELARTPLSSRLTAALIDLVLASMLGGLFGMLVWIWGTNNTKGDTETRNIVLGLMWAISLVLYHLLFEGMKGTTFGKRIVRCRLVDARGETPYATRIVGRVLLRHFQLFWVAGIANNWFRLVAKEHWSIAKVDMSVTTGLLVSLILFSAPLCIGERRPFHDLFSGCWLARAASSTMPVR